MNTSGSGSDDATHGDLHRLRQVVYRTLAASSGDRDDEFSSALPGLIAVLDRLGLFDYAYAVPVAQLVTVLQDPVEPDADPNPFTSGVNPSLLGPRLRESDHVGNPRTGDTARLLADLRYAYGRYGVPMANRPTDQLDHVSTELAVLAALCEVSGDARASAARLGHQQEFLTAHVLRWVPALAQSLAGSQGPECVHTWGLACVAFLEHERQQVPQLLAAHPVETS